MRALLNNSTVAYEEDLEVTEILDFGFDDEYGLCFVPASEPDTIYYFPNAKLSKEETARLCITLFETGLINLTPYGKCKDIPEM